MQNVAPLTAYGWSDRWAERLDRYLATPEAAAVDGPRPGRVVRHDGAGLVVATEGGPVRSMFGPPVVPPPVVGDWVVLDRLDTPQATLPRDSLLRRREAGGEGEQPLVANVDLVLIICGLDRPVRLGRIQRTLTLAKDADADALVVLTKVDTVDPSTVGEAERTVAEVDPDLEALTLSARRGSGVGQLLEVIGTRTVALIGESGAGKSTLVNALVDGEVAAEGEVRPGDAKGRHTTTSRELHLLARGGVLVDTPGIREVGTFAEAEAVAETFPDIEVLAAQCRFRDCAHRSEPGCAVQAAIAAGDLDPARLANWRDLEAEASSAAQRSGPATSNRTARAEARASREAARHHRR